MDLKKLAVYLLKESFYDAAVADLEAKRLARGFECLHALSPANGCSNLLNEVSAKDISI